ncbi:MAG TPA: T9SS type A sorting domain-containing protein, partial [Flavipsychrobacter sp.]|nr:T9SS type A sorting domain-containing protein [Flavipsychrobacter sp.]
YTPTVLEVDNDGNIYLADYIGMRLRKIDAGTGIINTISSMGAGLVDGPLINSGIGMVWGITCDDNDDVYITDESCSCRKITTSTGMINIVAGDLVMEGFNGETGIATQIWFNRPMGLAVHPQTGDIIVADLWNNRIRMATQPDYEAPENPVSHGSEVGTGVGTPAEWTPTTVPVVTGSPAVNIYPNPSSGRFTMQNNSGKEMNINVFNNTGSLVYTTAVKGTEVSVDLGNQPAGVYHLVADGHNAGKIVVTK